jgi:hypothetical protein
MMQYEMPLSDWRLMSSAPQNATWLEAKLEDGRTAKIHWAEDLSGSDQPPFRGWFYDADGYFYEIFPKPVRWRPL